MSQNDKDKASRRLILDISSIARWLGPPVGIMRTEHSLARHAVMHRPDVTLSFFDKAISSFRQINPIWRERLIGWDHAIDLVTLDVRRDRKGLARLRPSRYPATMALERWRLTSTRPAIRYLLDRAQRLCWLPHGLPLPFAKGDSRFGIVPIDLALGAPLALGPGDVILSSGDDWYHKEAPAIAALKHRHGFRYVTFCYDLIPVLFPTFFPERDVRLFRQHWLAMFPLADRIIVTSERVGADIRAFCTEVGIGHGEIVRVPLGYDPVQPDPGFILPAGLTPGNFALLVSTIEPRKGHAMILEVWQRLVAEGIPQRRGFKLVLVGRPGWQVDEVLRRIAEPTAFEGTLLHLISVDDSTLAGLYAKAAFALYPSIYEGFGLPVIEALAHGRAVIASNGGAIPEAVGSLSPCLSVSDIEAWHATMRRWIEDPEARAPYEHRIRQSFAHLTWDQAAAKILAAAIAER